MTIKEKPLIDAVSRLGALPDFLFSNPIFLGFFTMLMCPIFGGVFFIMWASGGGNVQTLQAFDGAVAGGGVAVVIASIIYLAIAVSALEHREEASYRLQFVFGGVLCVIFLILLVVFALQPIRMWIMDVNWNTDFFS